MIFTPKDEIEEMKLIITLIYFLLHYFNAFLLLKKITRFTKIIATERARLWKYVHVNWNEQCYIGACGPF